jgi:Flp pilus assembly CpaE family ATPase
MIPYSTLLPTSPTGKSLLAFLQMIDTEHDYTIIDLAHAGPDLRLSLMRGADKVILVLNGAPSSLHGAAHKIVTTKAIHGDFERLHLIENGVSYSLPHNLLRGEIAKMTGISAEHWIDYQIPNSRSVAYWPGSFSTPASIGCKKTKRALSAVATLITDLKQSDEPQTAQHAFSKISEIVTTKLLPFGRKARTAPHHSGTNKTIHYLPSPEQSRLTDQEAAQPKARHRATSSGEVTG